MSTNLFKTVRWSTPFDPEWLTDSPTSKAQIGYPGEFTIDSDGGNITAIGFVNNYFLVGLQRATYVYAYTGSLTPLMDVKRNPYGIAFCRFLDSIELNGTEYLYYVSSNGDIRMTNGPSYDECISDAVRPLTLGIVGDMTMDNYYGDKPDCVPAAYYDRFLKILRFYYSDNGEYNNKVLSFNIKSKSWTTCDGTACAATSSYGFAKHVAILGTSDGSGKTYYVTLDDVSGTEKGVLDLGLISPTEGHGKIKIYNVTIWAHAIEGCNTELTVTAYNDLANPEPVRSETRKLVYNDSDKNIQRLFYNLIVSGHAVNIVIEDNGINANYAIDKIEVDAENLASPN